ncbi:hypothetical protein ABZ154_00605 [Streptomyces sp. NPDC006261]|uniref:hypothetical protein n=1 Tax=Streptomyces sp. NPDC006261 TaxID=3156739 RepID=UPI00339E364C
MATEAWTQARGRLARFLARGEDSEAVDAELEEPREDLTAARRSGDEDSTEDIAAAWRVRLRRALRDNPEAAGELRDLLDELAPLQPVGTTVSITNNTISGGHYTGPVLMAQSIHGGVHGAAPQQRPGAT